MSKKRKMSKSQRFSKKAYERKKRKNRNKTKQQIEKERQIEMNKKRRKMTYRIQNIMSEGRKSGISYKKTDRNISDQTHKNNVSAVNSLMKELNITEFKGITEDKIMSYFEEKKDEYNENIKIGGLITNKIKALKRFRDSVKVSNSISVNEKEEVLANTTFIDKLDEWKKENKIVRSKKSSHYMKPNAQQQKAINDRFAYLKKSQPGDQKIELAADFHRFSVATSARLNQAVNATTDNLEKLPGGRYIYKVFEKEDKTDKPRVKFIENENDIKFLDKMMSEARQRADKTGKAYLFEVKENGDNLSRNKIKSNIQEVYREKFNKHTDTTQEKVRYQQNKYEVEQNFVPHSSRSIAIQRELKARAVKYQRNESAFYKDLKEYIEHDISKNSFKKDSRGAVAYGYEQMRKNLGRELTVKEKAMYLTSVSSGHNRIDVMRDHYLSKDMNDWFKNKGIK